MLAGTLKQRVVYAQVHISGKGVDVRLGKSDLGK
jgi:hypothetical protein